MVDLDSAFVRFGELYPTPADHPNGGGDDWEGDCAAFCYRFGKFTSAPFTTHGDLTPAWAVALGSGTLDTDPLTAGPGSQHFWKQKNAKSGKPGHVATEAANHRLVMASEYCDSYLPGTRHLGYATVESYSARRRSVLEYMGHASNYAGAVINATGTAGSGSSALDNSTDDGRHDMKWLVVKNSDGTTLTGLLYGELTKQAFRSDPSKPATDPANAAFAQAEAFWAERSLDRQYVTDAQSILEDANLVARQAQFRALVPAGGGTATDLKPVLDAITALDKQDDDYQAQIEKILANGLTGTITVAPPKG